MKHKEDKISENKIPEENIMGPVIDNGTVEDSSSNIEVLDGPCVYLIQSGNSPKEFYSYNLPILDKDYITIQQPFQKGIYAEKILDKVIEEYFFEAIPSVDLRFQIDMGILIQKYKMSDLEWIMRCDYDAKNIIKDKIIASYQKLIPSLINKINSIESKTKNGGVNNNLIEF